MNQASENAEYLPTCLRWSREQRLRFFMMGVCLPMMYIFGSSYFVFTSTSVTFQSAFILLALLCSVSSTGMAACCISPPLGNRNRVQATLTFGVVVWLPFAFCVVLGSGMTALIPSVIMAGFIALCARLLLPIWPSDSRFSIRQILWLTTLAALLCAAMTAMFQFLEYAWIVLWLGIFTIPVLAFVSFAIAVGEIKVSPGTLEQRSEDLGSNRSLPDTE